MWARKLKARLGMWVRELWKIHLGYLIRMVLFFGVVCRRIQGFRNHAWEYLLDCQNGLVGELGRLDIIQPETWEDFILEPNHFEFETHWKFDRWRHFLHPSIQMLELPGGRVLPKYHALITAAGVVLGDVSGGKSNSLNRNTILSGLKSRHFDEDILSLMTDHAENYYHFLFDVILRISIYREFFGGGMASKKLLLPRLYQPFQKQILHLCGLKEDDWIECDSKDWIIARNLWAITHPINLEVPGSQCVSRILRTIISVPESGAPDVAEGTRMFIKRGIGGNRSVEGELGLEARLKDHGFVSIVPPEYTVMEQIQLFRNASVIVAPHGAALANLIFCQPGTRIIEVFNPQYVNLIYFRIAQHRELKYSYCLCSGSDYPPPVDPFPCWSSILYDDESVSKIERMLRRLGA